MKFRRLFALAVAGIMKAVLYFKAKNKRSSDKVKNMVLPAGAEKKT